MTRKRIYRVTATIEATNRLEALEIASKLPRDLAPNTRLNLPPAILGYYVTEEETGRQFGFRNWEPEEG